ncbi:MAG: patatin-like phospholipase family protein, partial [Candidatus Nitrotoga sp.]
MSELKECDLVMKGGITSGVVYPKLITQLAKSYRFVNIGGTSAGAIAAGFSAAAEYRRATGGGSSGFDELDKIPCVVGNNLLNLFQPEKQYKHLFKAILKLIENKQASKFWFFVVNYYWMKRAINDLPNSNFGFCSGSTVSGYKIEGLTNWLNIWLERCAGRLTISEGLPSVPLTFGMLRTNGIKLRTITTNLSQKSPVTLPNSGALWMKKADLEKLFPNNVVAYITSKQEEFSKNLEASYTDIKSNQYLRMPNGDDMPVLMGVRLSLSFPILLSAIPFYRNDWSLRLCEEEQKTPKVCWFSDGGISSNFPIHLFDSLFPKRPTFGIS